MSSSNLFASITNIDSHAPENVGAIKLIQELLQSCDPHLRSAVAKTPAYSMNAETFGSCFGSERHALLRRLRPRDQANRTVDHSFVTEYLGIFTTDAVIGHEVLGEGPKDFLCPERIKVLAKESEERTQATFVTVALHEWMHAALDVDPDPCILLENELHRAIASQIEEATANFGALRAMDTLNFASRAQHPKYDWLMEFALDFIRHQPPEYALGEQMFKEAGQIFNARNWQAAKRESDNELGMAISTCARFKSNSASDALTYADLCTMWHKVIATYSSEEVDTETM